MFVELPEEDKGSEDEIGELNYSMYGTRDAAQNWAEDCAQTMKDMGFQRGEASPCTYYHRGKELRTYIHGDDFVSSGKEKNLVWMKENLQKKYKIKTSILGPGKGDEKQVKILNRVLTWHEKGIKYEADPRHVEIMVKDLKLEEANGSKLPGNKDEGNTKEDCEELLEGHDASMYRAHVARMNYLGADRPDIAFAVKELSRSMSSPTKGSWSKLKKLVKYLKEHPRVTIEYEIQKVPKELKIFTDADWAGCKTTRKSTSGGAIMYGNNLLKTWSKNQSLVALSSGESEFYATLKASAEGLGIIALLKDWGMDTEAKVYGDASVALGIIHRRGLGRTRRIATGMLWIQEVAAQRRLEYKKVLGKENPADLMTKYLPADEIKAHCGRMSVYFEGGRAKAAPTICALKAAYEIVDEEELDGHKDEEEEAKFEIYQDKVDSHWTKNLNRICAGKAVKEFK